VAGKSIAVFASSSAATGVISSNYCTTWGYFAAGLAATDGFG